MRILTPGFMARYAGRLLNIHPSLPYDTVIDYKLEDLVERGVLMGVCADSYAQGQDAGAKAIKILKGAKPASLSIDKPKTSMVILNMQTAQKGKFAIPDDFIKTVTRKIE